MKASRFLEELPGEPALCERWQLEEGSGAPGLDAAPAPAAVGPRDPRTVPSLFGTPGAGEGGAARPSTAGRPPAEQRATEEDEGDTGQDDLPF